MIKRLTAWMRFGLTIFGRVLLANASAMSMLWHTAAVTFVEQKVLNSVWKRVNHFVDGKSCFRSKIAFDLRRVPKKRGGLGLIDPRLQVPALHAMWVVRWLAAEEDAPWRHLFWVRILEEAHRKKEREPLTRWVSKSNNLVSSILFWWSCLQPSGPAHLFLPDQLRWEYSSEAGHWVCTRVPPMPVVESFSVAGRPIKELSVHKIYKLLRERDGIQSRAVLPSVPNSFTKERWAWLVRAVVEPKIRQYLWRRWHGKLYLGETASNREPKCSFLKANGEECKERVSIRHFSHECATAKIVLKYLEECWRFWTGTVPPQSWMEEEWSSNERFMSVFAILLQVLYRVRSEAAIREHHVGAFAVLCLWKSEVEFFLSMLCRVRELDLEWWGLGGSWLSDEREAEIRQITVCIKWPPFSSAVAQQSNMAVQLAVIDTDRRL